MVRQCTLCKEVKEKIEFTQVKTKKGTPSLQSWCKSCKREVNRLAMAKKYTDPIYKEQLTLHRKEVGYTAKEYWVQRFGGVCHDCKQVYPSYVYDFHHINGDKEESPSHLIRNKGIDNAAVLEELNKCILLCANCHRIRHHGPTSETQESGKGGLKNESQ